MKCLGYLNAALLAATLVTGGHALAANVCQEHLSCATTMPVDGYCECRSRGQTEDGTVVPSGAPHQRNNSTTAGCGANPNSPGCR